MYPSGKLIISVSTLSSCSRRIIRAPTTRGLYSNEKSMERSAKQGGYLGGFSSTEY